jgi:FtsP/CotA-like multicopper oxidase with cupredoxin domain
MAAMMESMPEEQNEKMLKRMSSTMKRVGIFQTTITGLQREIEVIELAKGDRQLERNALRAVRQLNRALMVLGNLHRRMITGPRLERQMAQVEKAQQALLLVMPVGGAPPTPPGEPGVPGDPTNPLPLVLLTRDPHGQALDPTFHMQFDAFSCMVPYGSPETPDRLSPTFSVYREFRTVDIRMPDGTEVEFWGFVGEDEDGAYPSKIIRVPQGALFHGTMKPRKGTHTIHWHGIEPTAMNDGVGKLSFEVNSEYTYQWFAAEPGHYFYHCHHNTPLHFEYGMVGPLMVDPPPPTGDPLEAGFNVATEPGGYPTGGPGYTLRAGGPFTNAHGDRLERYDVEAIWLMDDVDPRWHEQSHDDGLGCPFGEDAGHNRFDPKYFLISGVPQGTSGVAQTITVRAGQKLLLRLVCACYSLMTNIFRPATAADAGLAPDLAVPAMGLPGKIIAMDARTLGHGPFMQYAQEVELASNEEFELTAARRYDIIFEPGDEHVGDHVYRAECFKYVESSPGQRGPKHVGALGIDGAYGLIRVLPRV